MEGMYNRVPASDGYRAYVEQSKGMQHQSCCAHLGRYLLDAIDEKEIDRHLFEREPEKAMTKIYGYEKSLKQEPQESEQAFLARILQCRQTYARPLMEHVDTIMS